MATDHRAHLWTQLESSLTSALIEGDELARDGGGAQAAAEALEVVAASWDRRAADLEAALSAGSATKRRESHERAVVLRSAARDVRALSASVAA